MQCDVEFGYQTALSLGTMEANKTLIELAGSRAVRMRTDF
jgi:hypothetical protein